MNDKEMRARVHRAVQQQCAHLAPNPFLAQRVLQAAQGKGEKRMKKKLSVGLILVMALVMASAVALAWSLSRQYFEDVAQLQFDSGYYDDWGWEEKQAMVNILQKHGLITPSEAADMKNEAEVDAYMIARYGVNGRSDVIGLWSILETELGPISTWTLEQKAWYTDMQIEIGLLTRDNDDALCALPEKEDMQPEAAIALAKEAILAAYGMAEGALDGHQVDIAFETHASDWERENLHYNIAFYGEGLGYYYCSITRDGRIMDSAMGEEYLSPQEQVQHKIQFANENDQEAIALFMQYANAHIAGDMHFAFWPLADKKAVTDQLRPVILENMAENPDYADSTRLFWATHFYGLPDEKALSQERAVALAKEQLTDAFGLSAEAAASVDKAGVFYEITDPEKPLWKITMQVGEKREEARRLGLALSRRYRVVLDAYTGAVLETHSFEHTENTPEGAALEN